MRGKASGASIGQEFLECAARFERIAANNSGNIGAAIRQAGAWAAKCLKRAVDSGLMTLDEGFPWPEPCANPLAEPALQEFAWWTSWIGFVVALDKCESDDLPTNLLVLQTVHRDTTAGTAVYETKSDVDRVQAENFAIVARRVAAMLSETVRKGSSGETDEEVTAVRLSLRTKGPNATIKSIREDLKSRAVKIGSEKLQAILDRLRDEGACTTPRRTRSKTKKQ